MEFKSRVVPGILIGGLVLAGGGSVIAASGGSSSHQSAAKAQYCPNGQPPKPGKKCKKPKKPHTTIDVRLKPKHRCYTGKFKAIVTISNKPKGAKTRVYEDGVRIKKTRRNHFKVRLNAKPMPSGEHKLKVTVLGLDGKLVKRTVTFRRC